MYIVEIASRGTPSGARCVSWSASALPSHRCCPAGHCRIGRRAPPEEELRTGGAAAGASAAAVELSPLHVVASCGYWGCSVQTGWRLAPVAQETPLGSELEEAAAAAAAPPDMAASCMSASASSYSTAYWLVDSMSLPLPARVDAAAGAACLLGCAYAATTPEAAPAEAADIALATAAAGAGDASLPAAAAAGATCPCCMSCSRCLCTTTPLAGTEEVEAVAALLAAEAGAVAAGCAPGAAATLPPAADAACGTAG